MGIVRFLVWTGCCVGLGVFLARFQIGGQSPVDRVEHAWQHTGAPKLDSAKDTVKDGMEEAYDAAKKRLAAREERPSERHTPSDKQAIERIISKRK